LSSNIEKITTSFAHGARSYITINDRVIGEIQSINMGDISDSVDNAYVFGSVYSQVNKVRTKLVRGSIKGLYLQSNSYLNKLTDSYSDISLSKGNKLVKDIGNKRDNSGMIQRFPSFDILLINKKSIRKDQIIYEGFKIINCIFTGKDINMVYNKFWSEELSFVGSYIEEYANVERVK
jgi:hypothetical protein